MPNTFSSALTENDLMTGDVAVVTDGFVKIGSYKVLAGQLVTLGNGNIVTMSDAIGRIYCKFQDASPAEVKGILRIAIHSPQDRPILIVREYRTELLNTSATDRTKQLPFPQWGNNWVQKDKLIVLEFMADTAATIKKANSDILFDITIQNL